MADQSIDTLVWFHQSGDAFVVGPGGTLTLANGAEIVRDVPADGALVSVPTYIAQGGRDLVIGPHGTLVIDPAGTVRTVTGPQYTADVPVRFVPGGRELIIEAPGRLVIYQGATVKGTLPGGSGGGSGGGGSTFVTPSPTTVADFTGSSWSPVFTQNTDWSPFTTSLISSAGYAIPETGSDDGPVVVDSLKTGLIASGFTVVIDFVLPNNTTTAQVEMDVFHYADFTYNPDYSARAIWPGGNGGPTGPGQLVVSGDNYVDFIPTLAGSTQRLAFTCTPTGISASSNGGTVTSDTIATTGATDIGFLFGNATVSKITFYPPVADANLPAMSAL